MSKIGTLMWLICVVLQVDDLERDAFEVLRLVRSLKNGLSPINRIPPELLTLIPDFFKKWRKNHGVVQLTHVCRAWRNVFVSHASLWTNFHCEDADKTRICLERSNPSPINLLIQREDSLPPHDPLLQVIPHAIDRVKFLSLRATQETIGHIATHLSRPAPLLEYLSIDCGCGSEPASNPVLTTPLFNGNLSSLRTLRLLYLHTELPWRNMLNLTSFTLWHTPLGGLSIGQLLDFMESTPRLESVELRFAIPTSGAQGGRLVPLTYLQWMSIWEGEPCSPLLNHLLIPVGAKLSIQADSFGSRLEDNLPRSLDNFRNLSDLTKINLDLNESYQDVQFIGPNGEVSVTCPFPQGNPTSLVLEYLAHIDTSKTEQLEINHSNPQSSDPPHRALLHMKNLRTLTLYRCQNLHFFIRALHSDASSSGAVVCPKLEDLILVLRERTGVFDIKHLINMTTARALGGAGLMTIRLVGGQDKVDPDDMLELRRHVFDVEYSPGEGVTDDDSD